MPVNAALCLKTASTVQTPQSSSLQGLQCPSWVFSWFKVALIDWMATPPKLVFASMCLLKGLDQACGNWQRI
eukprot:1159274-Pelagomonas_calceolata.AAC.6